MEQEVQEYLVFLKENASELRQLGKDWGMSDGEINGCIDQALKNANSVDDQRETPKNFMRRVWSYFRVFMKVVACTIGVIVFLSLSIFVVSALHEPTDAYVSKILAPYAYDVFRYVRLSTLPLHNIVNLTSFYDADCMVDNPWFVEEAESGVPCWNCEGVVKVTRINMSEEEFDTAKTFHYINEMKPVLFQKSLVKNVTYHDLRDLYLANQEILNDSVHEFHSSYPDISKLEDLFKEDMEERILVQNKSSVKWSINQEGSSNMLESVFPDPTFLPDTLEVTTEKTVFVDGPIRKSYELPASTNSTWQLYIQGNGTRRVVLKPAPECRDTCSALLINVSAGDTLMFTWELWRVYLLTNGDDISVGFLASFKI